MRLILVFISIAFSSCLRGTYFTLQKNDVTLTDTYEIKSMTGCCGCKAILYNVTRDKKLTEQFVMETNCD